MWFVEPYGSRSIRTGTPPRSALGVNYFASPAPCALLGKRNDLALFAVIVSTSRMDRVALLLMTGASRFALLRVGVHVRHPPLAVAVAIAARAILQPSAPHARSGKL